MSRFTRTLGAAIVGLIVAIGGTHPATAESAGAASPPEPMSVLSSQRFTLSAIPGAANNNTCQVTSRNSQGVSVQWCKDEGLSLIYPTGRVKALANTVGDTTFRPVMYTVMNERNAVAAYGVCPQPDNAQDSVSCLARWTPSGTLSLHTLDRSHGLPKPTSMNRHGDVVISYFSFGDMGMETSGEVWWADGTSEFIPGKTAEHSVLVGGVTDGRDIYGSLVQINTHRALTTTQDVDACLTSIHLHTTADRTDTTLCSVLDATPMRWRHGGRAQRLPLLSGYPGAWIDTVSPSGSHLYGRAVRDGAPVPIQWSGINSPPTPATALGAHAPERQFVWGNNHNDSIACLLSVESGRFLYACSVTVNGRYCDLTTDIDGLPSGSSVRAESIDNQGRIFATMFDPVTESPRAVLLTPVE